MSLQPLRISGGRKFAAGLAAIVAMTSMAAGFGLAAYSTLLANRTDASDSLAAKLTFLALTLAATAAFLILGHLLMRAALGRCPTGGGLSRFFRYQLAALGCGAGLGLGFAPAMYGVAPVWWVAGITAGLTLCAVSLLAFRSDRNRPATQPPHPHIGLTEGVVVASWTGGSPQARAPQLTVVRFADETGRARWVRHLVRQQPTVLGSLGQVRYDRRRPDRVLGFILGRPNSMPHGQQPPSPLPPPSR